MGDNESENDDIIKDLFQTTTTPQSEASSSGLTEEQRAEVPSFSLVPSIIQKAIEENSKPILPEKRPTTTTTEPEEKMPRIFSDQSTQIILSAEKEGIEKTDDNKTITIKLYTLLQNDKIKTLIRVFKTNPSMKTWSNLRSEVADYMNSTVGTRLALRTITKDQDLQNILLKSLPKEYEALEKAAIIVKNN